MPSVVHKVWMPGYVSPAPIYLDSSVVLGWLRKRDRLYPRAIRFVGDHLAAKADLVVSFMVLDEVMWRLARTLMADALRVRIQDVNLTNILKRNPQGLRPIHSNLTQAVAYVLGWAALADDKGGATAQQVVDSWLDRLQDIGGMHDAYHLARAEHAGVKSLATGDRDFRSVKTLPFPLQIVEL
jgi:predicted nucleic acid-binding protein